MLISAPSSAAAASFSRLAAPPALSVQRCLVKYTEAYLPQALRYSTMATSAGWLHFLCCVHIRSPLSSAEPGRGGFVQSSDQIRGRAVRPCLPGTVSVGTYLGISAHRARPTAHRANCAKNVFPETQQHYLRNVCFRPQDEPT